MRTSLLSLLLQKPLVTMLVFVLLTTCVFVFLQIIASDPRDSYIQIPNLEPIGNEYQFEQSLQYPPDLNQVESHKEPDLNSAMARLEDIKQIRLSVREELKLLQHEKTKILKEKASLTSKNEKILSSIEKNKIQLKQLELDLAANKKQMLQQSCNTEAVIPIVFNPLRSVDLESHGYESEGMSSGTYLQPAASHQYQFNLRLCPLTKKFRFTVAYSKSTDQYPNHDTDSDVLLLKEFAGHRSSSSLDSPSVCMSVSFTNLSGSDNMPSGANNLVISLSGRPVDGREHRNLMANAFIASPSFTRGSYRHNIDIVIPKTIQQVENIDALLGSSPSHSPLKRKYLASYFGRDRSATNDWSQTNQILQTIHRSSIDDMMLFVYNCGRQYSRDCYDGRERMVELSNFLIIVPDDDYDIDVETNNLIYIALAKGAIPVIFGSEFIRLPFDEGIDWRLGSILLPSARLPELHFILKSLGASDLYSLKYHGKRIFEHYLIAAKQVADAIIATVSLNRLKYPPSPIEPTATETHSPSERLLLDKNCSTRICADSKTEAMSNLLTSETLGPHERPLKSETFQRNYSLTLTRTYDMWNQPILSPSHLFPSHPSDPLSPSEYKFLSSDLRYRPINEGLGGSGLEFSQSLGGDYPSEQFTIILLTYERVPLLMRTLERLKNLAYLNKVLIVWNSINRRPHQDLVWPDIGVPIVLVKALKNSLNNRFLPYDAIETDAIFSMDDDSPLRPDEIVFAFRVWRESRDRIVGFPGRYHAWDSNQNSWMYNSNHSCELSMVLTGGAFFHKYYSYMYSQSMSHTIRKIVDKYMNCEDIAMNFLVAHLTRKPPIKVTSRWTFNCASCTTSLSEDISHFMERHECLNIFASIYGYMPLLSTQHRSDSILFKTRLPKDKQKCFKFV